MRIAFVSVPRFACAVEAQRDPRLARLPLIVGDGDRPKSVLDCSSLAQAQGVAPGMPVRRALSLCPDAVILQPDPVLYRRRWSAVLEALDSISPEVEDEGLGRAYLNVGGLPPVNATTAPPMQTRRLADVQRDLCTSARLRVCANGEEGNEAAIARSIVEVVKEASGLVASVGLAEGKFTAFAAASTAGPGQARALHAGSDAAFLAPLEVALLPVSVEVISRLQLLGLESIGEVASISLPALQTQFGFEGRRLWQLANGIDEERLRPRHRAEAVEASLTFEEPVGGIDILVAAGKQLLSRLRVPLRGRAARDLALQAELVSGRGWERRLVFREAVSENERLAFVLRSTLTNTPPPSAVKSLSLQLGGLTGETGKQPGLGQKGRLQSQLEEAIRQLKARYGFSPVYRCVDVEPWSVIPEERQILVESDA